MLSVLSLSISSQSVWFPRTVMPLVWCTPLWGTEDTYRWHMVNIQHFKIDEKTIFFSSDTILPVQIKEGKKITKY